MKRATQNTILLIAIVGFLPAICASSEPESTSKIYQIHTKTAKLASVYLSGENGTSIHLRPGVPERGANGLDFRQAVDSSLWLNYSVIKGAESSHTKNIYVRITKGEVPYGASLYVQADDIENKDLGNYGSAVGKLELSNKNQAIVETIESCYTGHGVGKGHRLTYSLQSKQYKLLEGVSNRELTVCYTIAD